MSYKELSITLDKNEVLNKSKTSLNVNLDLLDALKLHKVNVDTLHFINQNQRKIAQQEIVGLANMLNLDILKYLKKIKDLSQESVTKNFLSSALPSNKLLELIKCLENKKPLSYNKPLDNIKGKLHFIDLLIEGKGFNSDEKALILENIFSKFSNLENSNLLNAVKPNGNTFLIYAIENKLPELAIAMIKNGADGNKEVDNWSPLAKSFTYYFPQVAYEIIRSSPSSLKMSHINQPIIEIASYTDQSYGKCEILNALYCGSIKNNNAAVNINYVQFFTNSSVNERLPYIQSCGEKFYKQKSTCDEYDRVEPVLVKCANIPSLD